MPVLVSTPAVEPATPPHADTRYYNPLAGTLEAMLTATDYGLAAFVFRKDLRELLSTMVQLLESVERESEVALSAKQTAIALYYMAA